MTQTYCGKCGCTYQNGYYESWDEKRKDSCTTFKRECPVCKLRRDLKLC